MTQAKRGHDLFIVDNSVSGWTGLRYLEEWTGIAKAFDIATLMTPLIFDSCITMPKQARLSWTPLFVSGWVT